MQPHPTSVSRLCPSCHRCGAPFQDPTVPSCAQCFEPPRPRLSVFLRRLVRVRLRLVLLLVACFGAALGWGVQIRRHRLADNSREFYTHEEMAEYQAFLEAVAARHAREAEERAAAGGPEAPGWAGEASEARRRAATHSELKREYRWRAALKRDGW